jgi:hypothetical protein
MNFTRDSRSGLDSNQAPSEYMSESLLPAPKCPVYLMSLVTLTVQQSHSSSEGYLSAKNAVIGKIEDLWEI